MGGMTEGAAGSGRRARVGAWAANEGLVGGAEKRRAVGGRYGGEMRAVGCSRSHGQGGERC
eukprot:1436035-Prymnesium_polylepis.1